jgi:tRNA-splicing ligase RtcB
VGSSGPLRLSDDDFDGVLREGARWAVAHGHGTPHDLEHIEEGGRLAGADPDLPSDRARKRGRDQLGTLGSGNHFVEIGVVDELFDEEAARTMGLEKDQVTIMVHSGSRGFGHQVCDDHLRVMLDASRRYGIELPDRQLCCAPLQSREGKEYYAAMAAAVNFAFANRQLLAVRAREAFAEVLGAKRARAIETVYEVAHNIAKWEIHAPPGGGKPRRLCVHRKGATRAFGPGHPEVPARYRAIGQPVLIPGDMGRYSYVLLGTQQAYDETFGSCCHGAGRRLSRRAAKREARPRNVPAELAAAGILVRAASRATIDEEIPEAYKDVRDVVDVVHGAGIGRKVAMLKPMAVIKG